jgi:hypothetical protein
MGAPAQDQAPLLTLCSDERDRPKRCVQSVQAPRAISQFPAFHTNISDIVHTCSRSRIGGNGGFLPYYLFGTLNAVREEQAGEACEV